MTFCGSRLLLEDQARFGVLEDCLVAGCELGGMEFRRCQWRGVELREVTAPFLVFENADLRKLSVFRSSLSRLCMSSCVIADTVFDGLVLIRSRWQGLKLRGLRLKSSCLQRAQLRRVRAASSSFTDFEALESRLEDCVFSGCLFNITYGSGMNGFSGALIKNCVFYGCRFSGFPLRGAALENCVFSGCSGEISGEPVNSGARRKPLMRQVEAAKLLARIKENL